LGVLSVRAACGGKLMPALIATHRGTGASAFVERPEHPGGNQGGRRRYLVAWMGVAVVGPLAAVRR
jgi:hypothetical protein